MNSSFKTTYYYPSENEVTDENDESTAIYLKVSFNNLMSVPTFFNNKSNDFTYFIF